MAADGLPSGTVTFLFTDLVDSTRLWEEQPDEMRGCIARLDVLARETVEARGGVVVKSVGDGAMAAFQDADAAVDAAIGLQRAVSGHEWPVPFGLRVGVHSGHATPGDADYYAPAVNRASRIANAAHGGQVLLSESTATLIGRDRALDLGDQELKGLPRQHLYQALADGLRTEFPDLPTAAKAPSTLPSTSTSFIGRGDAVAAVAALVAAHPLVTLTGAGGSGKTRLSLAVAQHVADQFPDGLAFADLAATSDDAGVAAAVVTALSLGADLTADPTERIATYLAGRRILCILDNCEHLIDAVAELSDVVLAHGGPSRLLATSREPLGTVGEHVFAVTPLEVESEAVTLFEERARAASSSIVLDDTTRPAVLELCRRLDGIPLAVELAAARTTHLSPAQLVERLDDRLRILTGGRRRVSRHQTLAATLDWSHDLLQPDEQAALRRLAVLPASFSIETAERLVGVDDPLDVVRSLVEKSLLQSVPQADGTLRYRLLETVRLYASDRLAAAGEAEALHVAHRDAIVEWLEAQPLEQRWFGDRDVLATEAASIRAALQWSEDDGDIGSFATLASAVDWTRSSDWHDGFRWLRIAVDRAEELPPTLRLRLQVARMAVSSPSADPEALDVALHGLANTAEGDPALRAVANGWTALQLTTPAVRDGSTARREEVAHLADEGVRLSAEAPAPWYLYSSLLAGMTYVGMSVLDARMDPRAERHLSEASNKTKDLKGYTSLQGAVRDYLALCAFARDDRTEAQRLLGLPLTELVAYPMLGVGSDYVRILVLGASGQRDEALLLLRASRDAMLKAEVERSLPIVATVTGAMAAATEDWETASRLLGAGREGSTRSPMVAFMYFWARERVRVALPPDRCRALRDEGRALGPDRMLAAVLD